MNDGPQDVWSYIAKTSLYRESLFGDYPGSTMVGCLDISVGGELPQSFESRMDEQNKEYVQVEYMGKPAKCESIF